MHSIVRKVRVSSRHWRWTLMEGATALVTGTHLGSRAAAVKAASQARKKLGSQHTERQHLRAVMPTIPKPFHFGKKAQNP